MNPIETLISLWYTAGGFVLIAELSKWGNFWRKFDEMEKVPEARMLGGVVTVIMSIVIITTIWPVRVFYFCERFAKWVTTKTK